MAKQHSLIALACVLALGGCDRWRPRPPPPAQVEHSEETPAPSEQAPVPDR